MHSTSAVDMKRGTASTVASGRSARRPRSRWSRARTIAYWTLTLIVSFELVQGATWDLLQVVPLGVLGYPQYLAFIIGVWKLPCAITLLVPRFERLKEWAYAGAFFTFSGAAASYVFVGGEASNLIPLLIVPIVFAAITLGSWALRPADRRLAARASRTTLPPRAWIVPFVIVVAFLAISLATLPLFRS